MNQKTKWEVNEKPVPPFLVSNRYDSAGATYCIIIGIFKPWMRANLSKRDS